MDDRRVLEDLPLVADTAACGTAGRRGGEIVLDGVEGDKLGAAAQQAIDLAIDVVVVDADDREADGVADRHFGVALLTFETSRSDTLDQETLEDDEEHEEPGSSATTDIAKSALQSDLPVKSTKLRKPELHGVWLDVVEIDQRPEEVVPGPDEGEDRSRRKSRHGGAAG